MEAIDHSATYKDKSFKNFVHRQRLNSILNIFKKRSFTCKFISYADFGCSNGFITNLIANHLRATFVSGFDWSDNIELAQKLYPNIVFQKYDLNTTQKPQQFDLVTCFETLEHVGNIKIAIGNLLSSKSPKGVLLISVPIEIGLVGVLKFAAKRIIFRYNLPLNCSWTTYLAALLTGQRISKYRLPADGYGSHFGFDYRDVDDILKSNTNNKIEAWSSLTTRFYLVN